MCLKVDFELILKNKVVNILLVFIIVNKHNEKRKPNPTIH